MNRTLTALFMGLVVFAVSSGNVWAQATAQISGTVKDQSGAVLPGVEITATQTDLGTSRTTVSNETGSFVLPNLPLGPYRFEAGLPGFRTFVQSGIVLNVNSAPVINPVLEVGQVNQLVEIQANAAQVETTTSSVGTVIDNQRIVELPLNGRNATDLITLAGAAVQVGASSRGMGVSLYPTPIFQVAGGLGYSTAYLLDGANFINPSSGSGFSMPFPDALQEFKVDTSGAGVNQGRPSAVSAVTKSGTNQLHGNLFEFVRNDLFNATSYFAALDASGNKKHSTVKRNQFGGTIGGAIKQDKLFFFGGYQQTLVRQDPADVETFLPTAKMLAGDWTVFASPACNAGRQLTLRAPFVNNTINPSQFSPTGLSIARLTLAGSLQPEDECGRVRYGLPNKTNEYQSVGRMDYQWSAAHTVFGRYQNVLTRQPTPYSLTKNILTSGSGGLDSMLQNLALGSTYVLSPNTVNALRISANWYRIRGRGQDFFSICDAQVAAGVPVTNFCGYTPHRTNIQVTSGPTIGGGSFPYDETNNVLIALGDDVSMIRGSHQMAYGFSLDISKNTSNYLPTLTSGKITIGGTVTGHGLGDLLTGRVTQLVQIGTSHFNVTAMNPAMYFADLWKAKSNLTLTLSTRWDPFIPQRLKHSGIANFDRARFNAGITTKQYKYAPPGWTYPGDDGHPGWRGANSRLWHFAPRLGLAWDPFGTGKTSIRASYSYNYSPVLNFWRQDPDDQNPWTNGTRLISPVGGLDDPWRGYTWVHPDTGQLVAGIPFPTIFGRGFTQDGDYTSTPYDITAPQAGSWNLTIQRQVGSNWLFAASYLGSTTTHIWMQEQVNPGRIISPLPPGGVATCGALPVTQCSGQDNTQFRRELYLARPNDAIRQGVVAALESTGTMTYHGMLLSAQKSLTDGTSVQTNYTWSHCVGDNADLVSSGPDAGESNVIPGNRRFDRGNCTGDRRQLFNLTALGTIPQFSQPALRTIVSGWQLSGIYRWSSGAPLNILAGSDRAMTGQLGFFAGTAYQRADQVLPNDQAYTKDAGGPLSVWLNPSAIRVPNLGTFGNYTRNNFVAPATWSFDMSLSRSFRIKESQNVTVRAEAFNVTNSFRPGTPIINPTSTLFGQIRSSLEPRIMQFALKYVF